MVGRRDGGDFVIFLGRSEAIDANFVLEVPKQVGRFAIVALDLDIGMQCTTDFCLYLSRPLTLSFRCKPATFLGAW